jgi:phosphohistidine swiveling domain-containing protein
VVNYDDESGRTDTVTSGASGINRTLLVNRDAVRDLRSPRFRALLEAVREIETVTHSTQLDIEFAMGADRKTVHIFQVRPITTVPSWSRSVTARVNETIRGLRGFVRGRCLPVPGVCGARSILGQMPDWNPAEMIGASPRPLSLSLYRVLITDRAWRQARRLMGYAEPAGAPLMVSLAGKPYIDVRFSFHSFLPAGLPEGIGHKLVDAWLDRLEAHPELHDKVEFEVAITALSLDFDRDVSELIPGVLSTAECRTFRQELRRLTAALLRGRVAPFRRMLERVEVLDRSLGGLQDACDPRSPVSLRAVAAMIEQCVEFGTIPFSVLARHAFIGRSFMQSMVRRGVADEASVQRFMQSVRTVAGELVHDMDRFAAGVLSREEFMGRYGHLRPGTYDILSPRYDSRKELLGRSVRGRGGVSHPRARGVPFSSRQISELSRLLREEKLGIGGAELLDYVREATRLREYSKFIFTKVVSALLETLAAWGSRNDLAREDLSFLTVDQILDAAVTGESRSCGKRLRELAEQARSQHETTLAVRLPHLICREQDVAVVPLLVGRPNFITKRKVRGEGVWLDSHADSGVDLKGRIVLIESADPGYDWIFSRSPRGLVTQFGGANSHMAIRCAEFGIPAVIGCGEQMFDRIRRSRTVELNCAEERVLTEGE